MVHATRLQRHGEWDQVVRIEAEPGGWPLQLKGAGNQKDVLIDPTKYLL
jgi:hypothetical protein